MYPGNCLWKVYLVSKTFWGGGTAGGIRLRDCRKWDKMQRIVCSPALHYSAFQTTAFSNRFPLICTSSVQVTHCWDRDGQGELFNFYFFKTWKHIHCCTAFFSLAQQNTTFLRFFFFNNSFFHDTSRHQSCCSSGFGPNEAQNCSCVNQGPHSAALLADKCVPQCGAALPE